MDDVARQQGQLRDRGREQMREESRYLRSHHRAREAVKEIVEMPDLQVDRVIRSIEQNAGKLSGALSKEVPVLEQPGVWDAITQAVANAFMDESQVERGCEALSADLSVTKHSMWSTQPELAGTDTADLQHDQSTHLGFTGRKKCVANTRHGDCEPTSRGNGGAPASYVQVATISETLKDCLDRLIDTEQIIFVDLLDEELRATRAQVDQHPKF